MDNFFSIGEVSKYQNISKQTLIFYDKIGLFRPAYVDPDNGYRYYSASQLDYLDTILIMKKAGLSLNEIREHMQHYNTQSSLAMLRRQMDTIEEQMENLRQIQSRLKHRCDQIESVETGKGQTERVTVEEAREQYILTQAVEEPGSLRETSIATKKCFARAFEQELPVFFQSGVIVPLDKIRQGRCTEAAWAFLLTEKWEKTAGIRKLPAGKSVSTFHMGDYLSIGRSYQRILDYCEKNSLQIISDSYEFCINDYITTRDEKEYITKIMFYVK